MLKNIYTFWKEYRYDVAGVFLMFALAAAAYMIRYAAFFSGYGF